MTQGATRTYLGDSGRKFGPLSRLNDEDLALLAQGGDRESECALVERYAPMCRQVGSAYRRVGVDEQDLTSEALLGLVKCVRGFNPALGSFRGYARMAIIRCALEALLRAKNIQIHELPQSDWGIHDELAARTHHLPMLDAQIIEDLQLRAVASLMTRRQREMLAYLVQTGDIVQTAQYFGCSRQRVHFIVQMLRDKIAQEETPSQ